MRKGGTRHRNIYRPGYEPDGCLVVIVVAALVLLGAGSVIAW